MQASIERLQKLNSYHCLFHYQGAYDNLNLAVAVLRLKMLDDAMSLLDQSINLYRENPDSYYIRGFVKHLSGNYDGADEDFRMSIKCCKSYKNDCYERTLELMPYQTINNIDFTYYYSEQVIQKKKQIVNIIQQNIDHLYEKAYISFQQNAAEELFEVCTAIKNITSHEHSTYHICLADTYFKVAHEHFNNNLLYEALYFTNRALETDKANPHNEQYRNFIMQCKSEL